MHIYEKDGKKYPSVTTILSLIEYNEDLMKWANIMGFQHKSISTIQEKACNFGTLVHSNLQHIVDPKNLSEDDTLKPKSAFDQFDLQKSIDNFCRLFASKKYETIYTEKTIISELDGYAGTLDWFCKMDNVHCLFDFKTSKRPYKNYLLQLGGYARLLEINGDGYPNTAGIIIVNASGAALYPIKGEALKDYTDIFLDLVKLYKKIEKLSFSFDN